MLESLGNLPPNYLRTFPVTMDQRTFSSLVGTRLGAYKILREIGRGGMGVVCLAEDTRLRRKVALKVLPADTTSDSKRLKRFRREAEALAALSHPGIVTLHSVEEVDGIHFLTMELVDGPTLGDLIAEGGISVHRAMEIGLALASALEVAHEHGVLHRDIKPTNVMIGKGNWVKLLDFGLAKLCPSAELTWADGKGEVLPVTQEGNAVGTLGYMSPEQLLGLPADERSDVFSLGLVLYEILAASLPFAGETSAERIAAVLRDDPLPLSDQRSDLPEAVVGVVDQCLKKRREDRFASATELREALEVVIRDLDISKLLKSGAVQAASLPSLEERRSLRWPLGLGSILVVGFLLAFWWSNRVFPEANLLMSDAMVATVEERKPTIAVLPLGNFSGDPEYFVEGMTDSLIGSLSRTGGLTVISRRSVMRYQDSTLSLADIAEELNVDYLIEGSVARQGESVHVEARVMRPNPERQVWARVYDRPIGEVFALHDEIGGSVVAALGGNLAAGFTSHANGRAVIDPLAYEAYLQGHYWGSRFEETDLRRAQAHFEKAVAIDPSFAEAWAGLSETLITLGALFADADSTLKEAEAAAQRALQLDPSLPDAHALLGDLRFLEWQWSKAEEHIQRAIALDPSSAVAHRRFWMLLACQRRFEEAGHEIEMALRLDPLSAPILADNGVQRLFEGDIDDAERTLVDALRVDPDYALTHGYLWTLYHQAGRSPEQSIELQAYLHGYGYIEQAEGFALRLPTVGYKEALFWVASELVGVEDPQGKRSSVVAGLLAASGQNKLALQWLESAYETRVWDLAWIGLSPDFETLWGHPELDSLLAKVGVPASEGSL